MNKKSLIDKQKQEELEVRIKQDLDEQRLEKQTKIEMKQKQRKDERQNFQDTSRSRAKHISKEPLYVKIEEKYKKLYEIPTLEEQKKTLEQKRSLYKPMDSEDLKQHAQNYQA